MNISTNQSPAVVLRLSRVSVKLIHVDRSDWKMSMTPDMNTGVRDTETEPIEAKLAVLPSPYSWINVIASYDGS